MTLKLEYIIVPLHFNGAASMYDDFDDYDDSQRQDELDTMDDAARWEEEQVFQDLMAESEDDDAKDGWDEA